MSDHWTAFVTFTLVNQALYGRLPLTEEGRAALKTLLFAHITAQSSLVTAADLHDVTFTKDTTRRAAGTVVVGLAGSTAIDLLDETVFDGFLVDDEASTGVSTPTAIDSGKSSHTPSLLFFF